MTWPAHEGHTTQAQVKVLSEETKATTAQALQGCVVPRLHYLLAWVPS